MNGAEGLGKSRGVGKEKMASMEVLDDVTSYLEKISTQWKRFLHGNYDRELYILTLATSILFLGAIRILFGPQRRRSRNMLVVGALWASHYLPPSVISNTLGLMQSPPYENEGYAIWAMLCLLMHGISNSTLLESQDTLHEYQDKRQVTDQAILLFLASWLMYLHHHEGKLSVPLISILGVAFVKFIFRLIQISFPYSLACGYFGLRSVVKSVAAFMSFEHELSLGSCPKSMKGYKYLVKGEENILELIANKEDYQNNLEGINERAFTLERIWQCNGTLLRSSEGEHLKDKCLSFALFRLLVLRFRGFPSHKEQLSKTWGLVRDGLLSQHERTFRIIEDELSFLYDYFYTQYPLLFSPGKFFRARTAIYAFLEFSQLLACLWIIIALAISGQFSLPDISQQDHDLCETLSDLLNFDCSSKPADIYFFATCIFVVAYVVLRVWQLLIIAFTNWAKVWLVCEYVDRVERPRGQGNETLNNLVRFVCNRKIPTWKPWNRKMGQYFLLFSYRYNPIPHFDIPAFVDIPKRVTSAVLDSLMENGLQLTNGLSSLQRNNISSQLSWACRLESVTNSILVWHVATSFCAMEREYGKALEENESPDITGRELAECLSGYCAYLVASSPAMLPDPTDATAVIFDKAKSEARGLLGSCRDRRALYGKLKELGEKPNRDEVAPMELQPLGKKPDKEQVVEQVIEVYPEDSGGVVRMGAKLGKQLQSAVPDEAQKWKVLVDFWAEMTLFLAPSNNLTAHAESLANGGEFITLLWALLTHVGSTRPREDDENIDSFTGKEEGTQSSAPPSVNG